MVNGIHHFGRVVDIVMLLILQDIVVLGNQGSVFDAIL